MFIDTKSNEAGGAGGMVDGVLSLEAADGTVVGAMMDNRAEGFSGEGYVDFKNKNDDSVAWAVDSTADGQATLTIDYALVGNQRSMDLIITDENGNEQVITIDFEKTGGNWSDWGSLDVTIQLSEGTNTIELVATGDSGPNIDGITITPDDTSTNGDSSVENLILELAAEKSEAAVQLPDDVPNEATEESGSTDDSGVESVIDELAAEKSEAAVQLPDDGPNEATEESGSTDDSGVESVIDELAAEKSEAAVQLPDDGPNEATDGPAATGGTGIENIIEELLSVVAGRAFEQPDQTVETDDPGKI